MLIRVYEACTISMVHQQNRTYFIVVKMVHCEHEIIVDNVNLFIEGAYVAA